MRQTITTLGALRDYVPEWMGRPFAFDVETDGLDPRKHRLLGLALAFSTDEQYYITLRHTAPRGETVEVQDFISLSAFAHSVKPLFAQTDVVMVAHNAKFDWHFMTQANIPVCGRLFDTMLAEKIINENHDSYSLKDVAPRKLGFQMNHYQDLALYPGFGKDEILGVPLENAASYAMDDVLATYALWERQRVELAEEEVEEPFYTIWMPLLPVLAEMETRGMRVDLDKTRELIVAYEATIAREEAAIWQEGIQMVLDAYANKRVEDIPSCYLRPLDPEELDEIITDVVGREWIRDRGMRLPVLRKWYVTAKGERKLRSSYRPRTLTFNVGSKSQLAELLYGYYQLTPPSDIQLPRNKNGEQKVDKDTIKVIRFGMGDKAPPLLDHILEWSKAEKIVSTYLKPYLEHADEDGRVHTTFNQHITATGRLSSSNPINLQNQPSRGKDGAKIRSLFIAAPGHKLIVADSGQLELRLLAHYSRDPDMMRAFTEGLDLHTMTGARQAGMTYEELAALVEAGDPEAKLKRTIGKSANFGLTYGMGPQKYQIYLLVNNDVYFPLDEVKRQIKANDDAYPVRYAWSRRAEEYAAQLGFARCIGGVKRRLPDLRSSDRYLKARAQRQAVNFLDQGGAAVIIATAMIYIQEHIRQFDASLLAQVHDEVCAEAPEEHAEKVAEIITYALTDYVNEKFNLRCKLVAEAGIGDSWYAAKH